MNRIIYEELIAFHPGCYVKEGMESLGLTQEELSKRLQTSPKYVSDLVNGRINLSDDMVLKLANTFGTSTSLWLNLNQSFLEKKLEIEQRKQMAHECELVRELDYNYWVNLGLVEPAREAAEKVRKLQNFFKVSSLAVLCERDFLVQYRAEGMELSDRNIMNANAWVQTAMNIGATREVATFDKKKLAETIPEIRRLTTTEPEEFCPKLEKLLADCGVVFVLLPHLRNCGVNGAVKWLGKEKVLLAMNERRNHSDTFWSSLFHELGHVRQQRVKALMISEEHYEELAITTVLERLENEAEQYARDTLIPKAAYEEYLETARETFHAVEVETFAKRIGIHPGIVVGRLQQDGYLSGRSSLNRLKVTYAFDE